MEKFEIWLNNNDLCDSIIYGVKLSDNLKDLEINIDYYFAADTNNKLKLVCVNCFALSYNLKDKELLAPLSQFNIEAAEVVNCDEYILIRFTKYDAVLKKYVTFFEVKCKEAFITPLANKGNNLEVLDYKQMLDNNDFDGKELEIWQSTTEKRVEISGNKNGLLYLSCRIAKFALEDCAECEFAELNLDAGIDTTDTSSFLTISGRK